MLFAKFFTLGLFAIASASPIVVKRDFAAIQKDFAAIDSKLDTIDTKVKAYTGTLSQSLSLYLDILAGQKLVQTATSDITANGALTADQSGTLNTAGGSTVGKLETILGDVIPKIDIIKKSGYYDLVFEVLADVKSDADKLLAALAAAVDPSYSADLAALQARIEAAYQALLDALKG